MRREGKGYRVVGNLDVTDTIMRDTFWVGVYPGMSKKMISYVTDFLIHVLDQNN